MIDADDIDRCEECKLEAKKYDLNIQIVYHDFIVFNTSRGINCRVRSLDELVGFLKGFEYYWRHTRMYDEEEAKG